MENEKKDWKFLIIFIVFWCLIIIGYFGVQLYKDNKSVKDSFSNYKYYDITNNYNMIDKLELSKDKYFNDIVSASNYEGTLLSSNFKSQFIYYLLYLNKANDRLITISDNYETLCISSKNFYKSIEELFGLKKSSYYERLKFVGFINLKGKNVCFDMSALEGIDDVTFVAIKSLTVNEDIITCNLYYYSLYINEEESESNIKNIFYSSVSNDALNTFNSNFVNKYNGSIEEKVVKFKENPKGRFFKYQLVSAKTIN